MDKARPQQQNPIVDESSFVDPSLLSDLSTLEPGTRFKIPGTIFEFILDKIEGGEAICRDDNGQPAFVSLPGNVLVL